MKLCCRRRILKLELKYDNLAIFTCPECDYTHIRKKGEVSWAKTNLK